ncbi:MAG: hypothetical protein GY778_13315, partial [bacterium]|nr:hypothetical protein [bacterium]
MEKRPHRWWSWWHLPELAAVFAVGWGLMAFFYAGTGGVLGRERGVPGHDSYYHIKMAQLLPELGLIHEFPWLRHAWFAPEGDAFVSHHYGFHLLLVPFVKAAGALGRDPLSGGRWAISTCLAAGLMLFNLILMSQRVRCRWLWLALFLLLPREFFYRQLFVRAIAPSLLFMLIITLLMFRRRYACAGLAVAAYTHLYFGGVIFAPVLVICFVVAGLLGPPGDRVSWKVVAWTLGGWLVGVITHPYADGMFAFLKLQVFGTGLTPDISVGREWKPYDDVWQLTGMCATTAISLAVAIALRLRRGPRAGANEMAVLLTGFVFAALMFKSRRFVEYWPPFALLGAALLSGPVLNAAYLRTAWRLRAATTVSRPMLVGIGLLAICLLIAWLAGRGGLRVQAATNEWRLWALLVAGYALVPLTRYWKDTRPRWRTPLAAAADVLAVSAAGVLCVVTLIGVLYGVNLVSAIAESPFDSWADFRRVAAAARLPGGGVRCTVPGSWFGAVALVYLLLPMMLLLRRRRRRGASAGGHLGGLAALALAGVAVATVLAVSAGPQVARVQRMARGKFDLPALRGAMDYLETHSDPGSAIFTDDWDVFPVYFYVNHYNHYCVGLDPKFTHRRDPV